MLKTEKKDIQVSYFWLAIVIKLGINSKLSNEQKVPTLKYYILIMYHLESNEKETTVYLSKQ